MTKSKEKLLDVMEQFDTAMLVTRHGTARLTARPMTVAKMETDGRMWFATERASGKIDEVRNAPQVAVVFQSRNQYVSVSGVAKVVDDRAKIDELWSEAWRVWFPEGRDDPTLTLLHVTPEEGEYWDNAGWNGWKYLVDAGVAYFKGEKATTDESVNASADLS